VERRDQQGRVSVRAAGRDDAEQLARLFDQLGHPQTKGVLRDAIERASGDPRAGVLVATDGAVVVGATTYALVPVLHDGRSWCRMTALVVDEASRGRGMGELMVAAMEAIARDAGCSRIEVTSARHRSDAHASTSG
jgi:N-acetylglutamate synthase-like GNAT family acetyltransferase